MMYTRAISTGGYRRSHVQIGVLDVLGIHVWMGVPRLMRLGTGVYCIYAYWAYVLGLMWLGYWAYSPRYRRVCAWADVLGLVYLGLCASRSTPSTAVSETCRRRGRRGDRKHIANRHTIKCPESVSETCQRAQRRAQSIRADGRPGGRRTAASEGIQGP